MSDNGLTERELQIGYWVTTRRVFIYKLLVGFLVATITLTFSFSLWRVFSYYVLEYNQHRQLFVDLPFDLINLPAYKESDRPTEITILSTTVLPTTQQKYDFIVKIANPNPKWYAEFDYQFLADGLKSKSKRGFLLPGEERYLIDGAVESTKLVRQPVFEISNLEWKKVLDFETFRQERLGFKVEDLQFTPANLTELSGKVPVSKTTFKVTNTTAYNFWEVGFNVVLLAGSRIVGANFISLKNVRSSETLPFEVNWFDPLPSVTKVEVQPVINILNPKVFLDFEKSTRTEFRDVPKDR